MINQKYKLAEIMLCDDILKPMHARLLTVSYGEEPPELDTHEDETTAFHFYPEDWQALCDSLALGKPYQVDADYGWAIGFDVYAHERLMRLYREQALEEAARLERLVDQLQQRCDFVEELQANPRLRHELKEAKRARREALESYKKAASHYEIMFKADWSFLENKFIFSPKNEC